MDSRSCICRGICDVPVRIGLFHSERSSEMGIARSYYLLDSAFMGKEFHGIDGLLYRLRPDVQ